MKLTPHDFLYFGTCSEGLMFSELSLLHLQNPFLTRFKNTPSQDSILAYLPWFWYIMHLKKRTGDNTKSNIIFYAHCVLYVLSAAVFTLGTER